MTRCALSGPLACAAVIALIAPLPVRGQGDAAAGAGAWTPEATQAFTQARDAQVSPDGRWVAFETGRSDLAANRRSAAIGIVSTAGGAVRVLAPTLSGNADATPRWSPDGRRLAFLTHGSGGAGAAGGTELWTMAADGHDRRRVCAIIEGDQQFGDDEEGDTYAWSPDGHWFVFAGIDPAAPAPGHDPYVITRFMYQSYADYADARPTQLWIVAAQGGAPRRVSDGQHADLAPAWSPDGHSIVFVSNREPDPDLHRKDDLWVVDVAGGSLRRLTDGPGSAVRPVWSPDGHWIAYLGTRRKWATYDSMAEDYHAWVIPAAGGAPRDVNAALDRRTASVAWAPDSRAVLFTAEDRGRVLPYRVPIDSGESRPLFERDVTVDAPSVAPNGQLAFTLTSTTQPSEVWTLDPERGGGTPRQVTTLNAAALATHPVRDADTVWTRSTEGAAIEGWLMRPAGADTGHRVPLILFVHGGPHGQYGYRFTPEYQMYVARGYAVLYVNPRGSTGYGQAFADACLGNWGGVDYTDLMLSVDRIVATHPEIDPDRMAVTGVSYGGFMTNWIVTHTGRFRAAVTREGMSNLMTDQLLSDAWDLEVIEFGPQWGRTAAYLRWSPIEYIANAVTPTLIIQGGSDHDVTFAEAGQMYAGLRLQGVESELVMYPREPHGFREPRHIVDAYARMQSWFAAHLTGSAPVDQRWDADRGAEQWSGDVPARQRP
jgi:dipeptidyl aminopeptidase/acylaminoacyl peptidase